MRCASSPNTAIAQLLARTERLEYALKGSLHVGCHYPSFHVLLSTRTLASTGGPLYLPIYGHERSGRNKNEWGIRKHLNALHNSCPHFIHSDYNFYQIVSSLFLPQDCILENNFQEHMYAGSGSRFQGM